jgi:hypothetical protein
MCNLEEIITNESYIFYYESGFKNTDNLIQKKKLNTISYNKKFFTNIGTFANYKDSRNNFNITEDKYELITTGIITNNYSHFKNFKNFKNLRVLEIEISKENMNKFNALIELEKLEILLISNAFGWNDLETFYENMSFLPANLKILIITDKFVNFKYLNSKLPLTLEKIIIIHSRDDRTIYKIADKISNLPLNCKIYHFLRTNGSIRSSHELMEIE